MPGRRLHSAPIKRNRPWHKKRGQAGPGKEIEGVKDPLNALLSFVYSVLTHDMAAALGTTGLDPAVGFLHADRPGRLSLALDLLEEFRAAIADRLVISLINLKQVQPDGFETQRTRTAMMSDSL